MKFAAGQLNNALGVLIACHLEQCDHCKSKVASYEALGGDILSELPETQEVSDAMLPSLLSKLDASADSNVNIDSANSGHYDSLMINNMNIPRPLRRFIPAEFAQLQWSGFSSSIKEFVLPLTDDGLTAKLYKIAAGKELPEHTHKGNEFTLVMEGSFTDNFGIYQPGDFILADTSTRHQPKAANDSDCICFAVMDAPLKMTGFFGRMLNPFMR